MAFLSFDVATSSLKLYVGGTLRDTETTADRPSFIGMGMTVPFEELTPGSLINLNRTNGTGHAVVFLSFIDGQGNELPSHGADVVGFKYFSSQGGYDAGAGGLDYRYAIFSQYGQPTMPYKRDVNVIDSEDQKYLNTGVMYAPKRWLRASWSATSRAGKSSSVSRRGIARRSKASRGSPL